MNWISVNDRLPEDIRNVLVTDGTDVSQARYESDGFHFSAFDLLIADNRCGFADIELWGDITHWCEINLPETDK
jgi:hypothetical protein